MKGNVSIWLGKFESEEKLNEYVAESYNKNGNLVCDFYSDFKIDYLDSQFREVAYNDPLDKSFLSNASYAESFIDTITADLSKYNSVILAFYFEYGGEVQRANGLEFYAILPYVK